MGEVWGKTAGCMPRFHVSFVCLCLSCFLSCALLIHERSLTGDNVPVAPPLTSKPVLRWILYSVLIVLVSLPKRIFPVVPLP